MERYFLKLKSLATAEMRSLRKLGREQADEYRANWEDFRRGNLTERGYNNLNKALNDSCEKAVSGVRAQIATLQAEYNAAVDEACTLNSAAVDSVEMEMLKSLPITVADFERLVDKHKKNETMLRILDAYRKEKNIKTPWTWQTPEKRKEIFDTLCWTVEAIVTADAVTVAAVKTDEFGFMQKREQRIASLVANAYRKLRNADPNKIPIPKVDTDDSDEPLSKRYNLI